MAVQQKKLLHYTSRLLLHFLQGIIRPSCGGFLMTISFKLKRSWIALLSCTILLHLTVILPSPAWAYYHSEFCMAKLLPPPPKAAFGPSNILLEGKIVLDLPYFDTSSLEAIVLQDEGIVTEKGIQAAYRINIPRASELRLLHGPKDSSHIAYSKQLVGDRYTLLLFDQEKARNDFMAHPLRDEQKIDLVLGEGRLTVEGKNYFTVLLNHGQYQAWLWAMRDAPMAEMDAVAIKEVIQDYYLAHYVSLSTAEYQAYLAQEQKWEDHILAILNNAETSLSKEEQEKIFAENLAAIFDRRMKELQAAKNSSSFLASHGLKHNDLAWTYWQTRRDRLNSYHPQTWNNRYRVLTFILNGQILSLFYPLQTKNMARQILEIVLGHRLAHHPSLRDYLYSSIITSNNLPLNRGLFKIVRSDLNSWQRYAFSKYLYYLTLIAN